MKNITEIFDKKYYDLPEKVLQIGEGNFLRSFADYAVEKANENNIFNGRVVIMQPNGSKFADKLNNQNCFYTLVMRGRDNGEVVNEAIRISSVSRCINPKENFNAVLDVAKSPDLKVIISNTTESGIYYNPKDELTSLPPVSYPAKLTKILFTRFKEFSGDYDKGLLILPTELLDFNGKELKSIVLKHCDDWQLGSDFINWLNGCCEFCSTLVDRIVTGYPKNNYEKIADEIGYDDELVTTCEPYFSWIIQGNEKYKDVFPIHKTGLNIVWTSDLTPYRTRKVRILNGAHTMSVLSAYSCGINIVRDMMNDELFFKYIKKGIFEEVAKTIDLPQNQINEFALSVFERFNNPFIDHSLLDISLNSVSKWKVRCLDSLLDYKRITGKLPKVLSFSLAALINFYDGKFENGCYYGYRDNEKYEIKDSKEVLNYFSDAYNSTDAVFKILSNKDFWGQDLTEVCGLFELVNSYYNDIKNIGVRKTIEKVVED